MAILEYEVKAFIVQVLACFDTPSQTAQAVRLEFGIESSRQHSTNTLPRCEAQAVRGDCSNLFFFSQLPEQGF